MAKPSERRQLEGKVALITGGGAGIGRAIAERLSYEGAATIASDINLKDAEATAKEIEGRGGMALALRMDVTDSKEVNEAVEHAWGYRGKIDILVNNAGVSTMNPLIELTEKEWDSNMDVNAKGVFLVTQAVVRRMLKHNFGPGNNPRIVNIASKAGKDPGTLLAHYAASKHAVVGFTKAVARELAPYGINVNCVCPGFVTTGMQQREIEWETMLRGVTAEQVKSDYLSRIPMRRLGTPDDVAGVVVFLCSRDADYMTAQSLNVDGGIVVF